MIPRDQFAKLRLGQFVPVDEIVALEGWEFLGRSWVGEAVGFSEWLQLEDEPDVLRSLAIDFSEFPSEAATEVLRTIGLPLHAGMQVSELRSLLGEPARQERFVPDRISYEFEVGGADGYCVSCTVLIDGGLAYLVVTAPIPL